MFSIRRSVLSVIVTLPRNGDKGNVKGRRVQPGYCARFPRYELRTTRPLSAIKASNGEVVTEAQRSVFNDVSHRLLRDQGAEAVLLGGTDLALAFNEKTAEFPLVDCAGIHADAIARLAITRRQISPI